MITARQRLEKIFKKLDQEIERLNAGYRKDGLPTLPKAEVKLLGQMSLLVDDKVSALLFLAQTADLDALLNMQNAVKEALKKLLAQEGLIYDEDSTLVWIPKDARFDEVFRFENITVQTIDPESALVSKAVKAPEKNKQLIREAIASEAFPRLVDRILENGGDLKNFL
jgi:hypothetical protein